MAGHQFLDQGTNQGKPWLGTILMKMFNLVPNTVFWII
jgi:hypothetical protein